MMNLNEHINNALFCDLCNSDVTSSSLTVAKGKQRIMGDDIHISTLVCKKCKFVFQKQRFSEDLLSSLYSSDSSFVFDTSEENIYLVKKNLIERQRVISDALKKQNIRKGSRVLDVGGGVGDCCSHLVDDYDVIVSDASNVETVDKRIKKVEGLFSNQIEPESIDVVILNHVLEHVFSPTLLLNSSFRVLRPGGIVIAEVPFELFTPLLSKRLGDWRHVGYFCRQTLKSFLNKTGFEVIKIELVNGCYGVRRLPVIRALAIKNETSFPNINNSLFVVLRDMFTAVAFTYLTKRIITGR